MFDTFERYLEGYPNLFPSEPVPTEECDVCCNRVEDFRISPDKGGFCCVDCLKERALPYYLNEHDSIEEVYNWFENLKIK